MKIRIKHILRCYQSGMSIRSISSSLLISRNTVKRYIRIYEDMSIELERLLKMDEQHLHELFGREKEVKVPVGRIDHIAGDQMYVDFAGDKLYIADRNTGDKVPVEVFAAILPCSQITYYESVPSQKKEYLIQACENAFHYFGGVPNAIVPDNLKSAVTKPGGTEPEYLQ